MDDAKVCLICGVDSNKKARYDRYNIPPPAQKKHGKSRDVSMDSDSDSQDASGRSGKKGSTKKSARPVAAISSRRTRNQNPKSFAFSLCKLMNLPVTSDQPFLSIFTAADYCPDCTTRVKDVHTATMELEKIQNKLTEARVDFELDLSKHLQKIPFCKNVLRTDTFDRYKEDISLILDFHDPEKKGKDDRNEVNSQNDQNSLVSTLKKRKAEENGGKRSDRLRTKKEPNYAEQMEVKIESEEESENSGSSQNFVSNDSSQDLETSVAESIEPEEGTDSITEGVEMTSENNDIKDSVKEELLTPEPAPIIVKVKAKKDPNLKCPHCVVPRYFNLPQSLEDHVAKVHNRPFSCDICERKFHTEREVMRHKDAVHDGEALYTCGFCDQIFKQKRYLEDHLDQHPQAKPLNCQFCGRAFKRLDSLQRAFQIYKGEPVDPCKNCGRNLNLKDYLEHNKNLK